MILFCGNLDLVVATEKATALRRSGATSRPQPAPAPTARKSAPPTKPEPKHKGTLALVLDVKCDEAHDRPVWFRLDSSDGSIAENRFVDEDKVDVNGLIEIRWHELPEDLNYQLTAKQADGDVEVLFSDRPFPALSAHSDHLDEATPYTRTEDQRNEAD